MFLETEDVSNDNDDEIETEDEPVYCPYRNKLLQIIETMQKFSLFSFSKDGAIVQCYANHVVHIIDQHLSEKSSQITIRGYFQSLQKRDFKRRKCTALSKFLIFSVLPIFRTVANSKKMSLPLGVRINRCLLYFNIQYL